MNTTIIATCCTLAACSLSLMAFVLVVAAAIQSSNISHVRHGAWPMAHKKGK